MSVKFKAITNDAIDRIERIKFRPDRWGSLNDQPSHRERARMIRFLAEEAAYAVEDWIEHHLAAGVDEYDICRVLQNGFRFDFVPCVMKADGRLLRRGFEREAQEAEGAKMLANLPQL